MGSTETRPAARVRPRPPPTQRSEESRRRLLAAATEHFAEFGLTGARVDAIARHAGVNKQLIYYYFGDKDGLYTAVLESAYADIRAREKALDLGALDPPEAMEALVAFTFDYLVENPAFVPLLTDENVHRGTHLRGSRKVREIRSPFIEFLTDTLRRGRESGVFRGDVDPAQFYISLAGMCFFYHSNRHTLSTLFDRDLSDKTALAARRKHVLEMVSGYLRPGP